MWGWAADGGADGGRAVSDLWNRCDECGRLIGYDDLMNETATRRLLTPDSEFTQEEWETLCKRHAKKKALVSGGNPDALD